MSPSPGTGEGGGPLGAAEWEGEGWVRSNDERERARQLRDRAREMRTNPTLAEKRLSGHAARPANAPVQIQAPACDRAVHRRFCLSRAIV